MPTGGGCSAIQQKHSQLGLITMPNLNDILKCNPCLYNAENRCPMIAYYLKISSRNFPPDLCEVLRIWEEWCKECDTGGAATIFAPRHTFLPEHFVASSTLLHLKNPGKMEQENWYMDFINWYMDFINWYMDFINWYMDFINWYCTWISLIDTWISLIDTWIPSIDIFINVILYKKKQIPKNKVILKFKIWIKTRRVYEMLLVSTWYTLDWKSNFTTV